MKWDETFLELTLEDIKENIEAVAKSRSRNPRPRETLIQSVGPRGVERILVTVSKLGPR